MHRAFTALAALAALSACGADAPDPATASAGHERMVASLDNRFIWDCTLQSNRGAPQWRFALQRVGSDALDVVVLEAGRSQPRPIENLRKDNAARIYFLRDGSRILIADDGEVRGAGQGGSRGAEYVTGTCRKGGQAA